MKTKELTEKELEWISGGRRLGAGSVVLNGGTYGWPVREVAIVNPLADPFRIKK